jgi:hypothetical protein
MSEKTKANAGEEMVEVYRCATEMEADRALVEVLEAEDIEGYRRDRVSHALPAPDSESGNYFIAVPIADAERARGLLQEALADEVLDADEGQVIERVAGR